MARAKRSRQQLEEQESDPQQLAEQDESNQGESATSASDMPMESGMVKVWEAYMNAEDESLVSEWPATLTISSSAFYLMEVYRDCAVIKILSEPGQMLVLYGSAQVNGLLMVKGQTKSLHWPRHTYPPQKGVLPVIPPGHLTNELVDRMLMPQLPRKLPMSAAEFALYMKAIKELVLVWKEYRLLPMARAKRSRQQLEEQESDPQQLAEQDESNQGESATSASDMPMESGMVKVWEGDLYDGFKKENPVFITRLEAYMNAEDRRICVGKIHSLLFKPKKKSAYFKDLQSTGDCAVIKILSEPGQMLVLFGSAQVNGLLMVKGQTKSLHWPHRTYPPQKGFLPVIPPGHLTNELVDRMLMPHLRRKLPMSAAEFTLYMKEIEERVLVWKGSLFGGIVGMKQGFITTMEGYVLPTSSKMYLPGKIDFLTFRIHPMHGFFAILWRYKLWAFIKLPSQTLILYYAKETREMTGMLLPGDAAVWLFEVGGRKIKETLQDEQVPEVTLSKSKYSLRSRKNG
ncbi:Mediator of RNA polymerase II transcription subunit 25-like protein [Drosera capensis]